MRREVLLLRRSAFSLTPVTREEHYLSRMIGQSGDVFPPVTRKEYYLAYMAGDDVPVPVPVTVDEMFLYALCGKSGLIPKPVTRLQMFMANSLGEEYELTPVTREEMYWNEYVGGAVYDTASGPIATFIAKESPVKQLSVSVEPVQNGTGDPSPTNVRPITGWDSVTVNRTGKNLLPKMVAGTYEANGGKIVVDANGVATLSGTTTASGIVAIIPLEEEFVFTQEMFDEGLYYHLNNSAVSANYQAALEYYDGAIVSFMAIAPTPVNRCVSIPETNIGKKVNRVRFWISSGVSLSGTYAPAFVFESTATAYEPYSGNTYTIQLGETVYGGTLDEVNGTMTVDRAVIDMGAMTWAVGYGGFYSVSPLVSLMNWADAGSRQTVMCEEYYWLPYSSTRPNGCFMCEPNSHALIVIDDRYTTAADFKAAVTGVQLVYPLATPFELTLTPEQISTLQGTNNVWSNAGDVTVEYRVR